MRNLVRTVPWLNARRSANKIFEPQVQTRKAQEWMAKLSSNATTEVSKRYVSQLGSLINYYNNRVQSTVEVQSHLSQNIDFEEWNKKITTPGFVEKVKTNYQAQSKEEYNLNTILEKVTQKSTGKDTFSQLSNLILYTQALWKMNYCIYLAFLSDLECYANPNEYSFLEMNQLFMSANYRADSNEEAGYKAGSRFDLNLVTYVTKSLKFFRKMITFYKHASDYKLGIISTSEPLGK